jgi:hypothetical protein
MPIASLINDFDVDAAAAAMRAAPAFPHFCLDQFLDERFAREVRAAFPAYAAATELGDTFNAVNEKRKVQITDATKFPPAILKLHQLLASPEVVSMFSRLSGIDGLVADPLLAGGGIHETNHGGHLDVHIDFNYNEQLQLFRRLNVLIYFNEDWNDDWGGILDLWDRDVKTCVNRISPIFNRAAGFATSDHSWHGVTPLSCPPGQMRKSFAVYYYAKEPAPGWSGAKYSTVFRARPTEVWKGAVAMPAEKALRAAEASIGQVKRGLKRLLTTS